jgi:hypothetical protein
VVLACDSQGTKGELKHATRKLFKTKGGVIWGTAGQLAGSQTLYTELEQLDLEPNPRREDAKAAIRNAMRAATRELIPGRRNREEWFEGLFGWYDGTDKRHYLMLARHDGHVEFMTPYGAVGSSRQFGLFGYSRSAFLDYDTLPLEIMKMLTYMVAEDAVRASAQGVDLPIQMAVVESGSATILHRDELQPIRDTVSGFQMKQLDFLKTKSDGGGGGSASGLIPGRDDN